LNLKGGLESRRLIRTQKSTNYFQSWPTWMTKITLDYII